MTGAADPPRPALMFFPYLPLRTAITVGPHLITPTQSFTGPWSGDRFEELAKAFMRAFVSADRRRLDCGAVVADRHRGCDGELIEFERRIALQRAVELAALDANPEWEEMAQAWNVVTSDNAELHAWPIDLAEARVALSSGFIASTLTGGLKIAPDLQIPAPEELHLPQVNVTLDEDLASATYRQLTIRQAGEAERRRLSDAIGWLSKAWRNTPSLDWPDRIVFLKTGFEALTGRSKTHEAATELRRMFEEIVGPDGVRYDGLLWSPTELESRTFVDDSGKQWSCTDLEHWFRSFGAARNAVIHGDVTPEAFTYEEAESAYVGPLFHTAERLLRESIKVALAGTRRAPHVCGSASSPDRSVPQGTRFGGLMFPSGALASCEGASKPSALTYRM